MSFVSDALGEFSQQDLEVLAVKPPTEDTLAMAARLGEAMGRNAWPGDLVYENVARVGQERGWPSEVVTAVGQLAYQGMQASYRNEVFGD